MKNKIEAEFVDNSFVIVKIPFNQVLGIIEDIGNLFKYKDESGKYNIGAHGVSIDLKEILERIVERREFESKLSITHKEVNKK